MKPSEALHRQRTFIRQSIAAHRACNGRVFGSVARGEGREDRDLDLLVDALPGATLFDLGGLQMELEERLGSGSTSRRRATCRRNSAKRCSRKPCLCEL